MGSSVALVHVEVDDGHAFNTGVKQVSRSNDQVVEEAEALRPVGVCMMGSPCDVQRYTARRRPLGTTPGAFHDDAFTEDEP